MVYPEAPGEAATKAAPAKAGTPADSQEFEKVLFTEKRPSSAVDVAPAPKRWKASPYGESPPAQQTDSPQVGGGGGDNDSMPETNATLRRELDELGDRITVRTDPASAGDSLDTILWVQPTGGSVPLVPPVCVRVGAGYPVTKPRVDMNLEHFDQSPALRAVKEQFLSVVKSLPAKSSFTLVVQALEVAAQSAMPM